MENGHFALQLREDRDALLALLPSSKALAKVRRLSLYRSRLNHNQFDIKTLNMLKRKGKFGFAHVLNADISVTKSD